MQDQLQILTTKLNYVRTSRYLKNKGALEQHLPLPLDIYQETEVLEQAIFSYLKFRFRGCKVRSGAHFSVRLDSDHHLKAFKLRQMILDNNDWRKWFSEKHNDIITSLQTNGDAFSGNNHVEYRVVDGKHFIYVPLRADRVENYRTEGPIRLFNWLDSQVVKNERASVLYDQVVGLMENEVRRREIARAARIEKERETYVNELRNRLLQPLPAFDRSGRTPEDKHRAKIFDWCTERGIAPRLPVEITPQLMVPVGLSVRIVAKDGERESNWHPVPMFDGFEVPEGFTLKDRWGHVTEFNGENKRARDGEAPIVIENFIYTSYDHRYWAHMVPAEHAELLEVSKQLWPEAVIEAEVAQREYDAEQTRLRAEEEERKRVAIELKRIEDEEKKARLAEEQARLREQLAQRRKEDPEIDISGETPAPVVKEDLFMVDEPIVISDDPAIQAFRESIRKQVHAKGDAMIQKLSQLDHREGIYRNDKGLSTERYILVQLDGSKSFHREIPPATQRNFLQGDRRFNVYDYWNPDQVIDLLMRG